MKRLALKVAGLAALVILAAGCAGTGAGTKYKDMAGTIPKAKPGDGRIYFFRADTPYGSALQPLIRLDKVVVGASKSGGFFYVDRAAGTYQAATSADPRKTLDIPLGAGETTYVRMSPSFGLVTGSIVLGIEPAEKARPELAWLSYTGQAIIDK
ncbi:MAG TPA: DUF2846 domain-containing protein [Variovorax sp.]